MSLMDLLLMLVVGAVVVWGVLQAMAGKWKELIVAVVVLLVALWILEAVGISLPNLPSL